MRALALFIVVVGFASGCPTTVGKVGCENARDCAAGQVCTAGQCVVGVAGCTLDSDCDVNAGEVCDDTGQCKPGGTAATCAQTSECPISQFCNTSTGLCADLADGFCRNETQCATATPVCGNNGNANVPGRCVQCLVAADCDPGQDCVGGGVCSGNTSCGPNSTANGSGQCLCNPGFHKPPGGTGCVADTTGEGEGEGAAGGEGEGEGATGDGPPCDPQNAGLECLASGGPYNNCAGSGSQGTCVCDPNTLFFECVFGDPNAVDVNNETCTCVDGPAEGEGEGAAGEGEGEGGAAGEGEGEGGNTGDCNTCLQTFNDGTNGTSCQTTYDTCANSNGCRNLFNCFNFGDGVCDASDDQCCENELNPSQSSLNKYFDVQTCFCDTPPTGCGDVCTDVLPTCTGA